MSRFHRDASHPLPRYYGGQQRRDSRHHPRQSSVGESNRRAQQRQDLLRAHRQITWRSPRPNTVSELLWTRSPSPPPSKEKSRIQEDSSSDSDSTTSSSSSSNSSSTSSSGTSSSSEERKKRRRRHRHHMKSRGRKREKSKRRKKRRRRPSTSSSSSNYSSHDSVSEDDQPKAQGDFKSKQTLSEVNQNNQKEEIISPILNEDDWKEAKDFKSAIQGPGNDDDDEDEDDEIGPMPLPQSNASSDPLHSSSYGSALLPGEGQALAAYVQQNLRIPRRGEIGYTGDDIESYENQGYVMSGSRHARMNAVRIRKENQVYSAEEQRALALITMEENQQKEAQLMQEFRTMLAEKKKLREGKNHISST